MDFKAYVLPAGAGRMGLSCLATNALKVYVAFDGLYCFHYFDGVLTLDFCVEGAHFFHGLEAAERGVDDRGVKALEAADDLVAWGGFAG